MANDEQPAGRLVAGDQEGEALGDDVVVGKSLPALLVDAGEHPAEQVGVVGRVALPPPVRDQALDQIDLELLVLAWPAAGPAPGACAGSAAPSPPSAASIRFRTIAATKGCGVSR